MIIWHHFFELEIYDYHFSFCTHVVLMKESESPLIRNPRLLTAIEFVRTDRRINRRNQRNTRINVWVTRIAAWHTQNVTRYAGRRRRSTKSVFLCSRTVVLCCDSLWNENSKISTRKQKNTVVKRVIIIITNDKYCGL